MSLFTLINQFLSNMVMFRGPPEGYIYILHLFFQAQMWRVHPQRCVLYLSSRQTRLESHLRQSHLRENRSNNRKRSWLFYSARFTVVTLFATVSFVQEILCFWKGTVNIRQMGFMKATDWNIAIYASKLIFFSLDLDFSNISSNVLVMRYMLKIIMNEFCVIVNLELPKVYIL